MIKDWMNPFSSFRARILIFVTVIVLTTIAAIYSISRHLEQRLAGLVAEHVKAISVSVDLAQSSFPSGEYIHDLLRDDGRITVGMEENHIIHKILIVDANDRVIDSADPGDKGKTSKDVLGDLMPLNQGKVRPATNADGRAPEMTLTYPVITDQGQRKVVIIISPHLLAEIVREESRERLIAIVLLSLLLILIFEPYFSTKETGIGLGLALARKLIEDHGGQIMISSEVGVGTTFMVILPREPVPEPHPASLPQAVLSAP